MSADVVMVSATPAEHAAEAFDRGWRPFQMGKREKFPPPVGLTGYKGRNLTAEEVGRIPKGANLALRMPPDVIGLDVDVYHDGDKTIAEFVAKYGPLPATSMTHSNRGDGSGIRFYRVPPGTMLLTGLPGVEIIQWFHRYAMVEPSVHPEGRNYGWTDDAGDPSTVPEVGDLPALPWSWQEGLKSSSKGEGVTTLTPDEVADFFTEHTAEHRPGALKGVQRMLAERGNNSRHDTLVKAACWSMTEAAAGWYSAENAETVLADWWRSVFNGADSRKPDDGEFGRALIHGVEWAAGHSEDVAAKVAELDQEPDDEPDEPIPPCSLDHAHGVVRRWFGDEYDLDAFDVVLAAAAVERLDGDPLWLLIVSGSGNAKTETVGALSMTGAHITSTISSVGALLSASPAKEKAKDSTGGLLRKIGDSGIIVIKDVTSILSQDRNTRGEVLAALREVYDGRWERNVGTDGGRTLNWEGRVVVIGAVTTAWDRAHDVISSMGDRFVLLRMDSTEGRMQAGRRSIGNTGHEVQMRAELAEVAAGVLNGIDTSTTITLTDDETETLLAAADIVTTGRTAVDYDYRGDVIDAHAPEMPTRFAKELAQVVRGSVAIGMQRQDAMRLAIRCARDSMPPMRLAILLDVAEHQGATTSQVRKRIGKPRSTVDRQLQSLNMLGLLDCIEDEEHTGRGSSWRYSLADGVDPDVLTITKFVSEYAYGHKKEKREGSISPTHISGDGPPTASPDPRPPRCGYCTGPTDEATLCLDGTCKGSQF